MGAHLIPTRKKGLLRYLPHRNLDVCNGSRLSHRAHGLLRASLGQNESRGGGVCFYINNSWCDERNLHSIKSLCFPDLEVHMLLCQPFWLPWEFTAIIITAVYIPPQANTDQELYGNISEQESTVMFDQPCQREHLALNPETLTIENKPVTISGNSSKPPNNNTKTKLKNNSTTATQ